MSDDDRMDRARRIRRMREGEDDRPEAGGDRKAADQPDEGTDPAAPGGSDDAGDGDADSEGGDDGELEMEWGSPGGDGDASESDSESTDASGSDTRSTDASGSDSESTDTHAVEEDSAAAGGAAQTGDADAGDADDGGNEDDDITAPLPGADELEEALDGVDAESDAETVTPDVTDAAEEDEEDVEETRVLEFTLHDEHYCLDIEYIEEIVREETITRVPNTPEFVEGVVDLRGQITTILNPKVTVGKPETGAGDLIVVFDADAFEDQGAIGWVVDDVRQVSLVSQASVNDPPIDDDHINGVIDREDEDEFVIWTTPELALADPE